MQTTHPMFFRRQFSSCARLIATLCLAVAGLSAQAGPIRYQPVVDQVEPRALDCDVAVYGGTPAGVTAAVQAARLGTKWGQNGEEIRCISYFLPASPCLPIFFKPTTQNLFPLCSGT